MRKCTKRWLLPVFAAAMTLAAGFSSLAAETVKVTVPVLKGGYISAWYYDRGRDIQVVLPIGETTVVPRGADMEVTVHALDYELSETEYISGFIQSFTANGESLMPEGTEPDWWGQVVSTGVDDVKFDAVFKGHLEIMDDTVDRAYYRLGFSDPKGKAPTIAGTTKTGEVFQRQLTLYDVTNQKDMGFSSVKNAEVQEAFCLEDMDWDGSFSVDEKGILRSTVPLEKGSYRIDLKYETNGEKREAYLKVNVGARLNVRIPEAAYQFSALYPEWEILDTGTEDKAYVDRMDRDTFKDVYKNFKPMIWTLENHTPTGFGYYNADSQKYESLMNRKVSDFMTESNPAATVDLMYSDFKPVRIAHLDREDIVPEEVEPGWHQQNGKWYFYETEDPASLMKNQWITCPEGNGCTEQVWVGADGAMAVNGVVNAQGKSYLVAENGHKVKDKTVTLNGVTYTTDGDGEITEAKVILATPSNAADALAQADKVIANAGIMRQDEKERAADMQTEALKTKIDITKLTADQVAKCEALYLAVYGEENIETEPSDAVGGIAAAGLTSEDFREGGGKVTIEYATEWPATSSNARVRGSVKLLVNGKERKTLTAPVTMTVEIPDYFIASYSNASYNYEVEGVDKADVDGEKGTVKITITKLGAFDVKAVKKPSRPSGGGSSSGNSHSSGRARVKADFYKTGKWVMNEKGWWYSYDDGTWPSNSWVYLPWKDTYQWYYFNGEGYMVTGWHHWQNNWYYLYPQADGNRGYMFTGWHEIGGKWYYFSKVNDSSLGAMAYDTTTPDGYKVDKDGAWIQ